MNPWFRSLVDLAISIGAAQAACHGLPGAQPVGARFK